MSVLSEYQGFRPIGATIFEKNGKKSKKNLFAKDKCTPLGSPEEINIFLIIGNSYETAILFDQFPISHWWNGFISIHEPPVRVTRDNEEFAKVRKNDFFEKIAK